MAVVRGRSPAHWVHNGSRRARLALVGAVLPITLLVAQVAEADGGSAASAPAPAAAVPAWLAELPPVASVLAIFPGAEAASATASAAFAVLVDVIEVRSGVDQSLMGSALLARLSPFAQARWKEYVHYGYSKILSSSNGSWQLYTSPRFRIQLLSRFIPRASVMAYETMRNRVPGVAGPSTAADIASLQAPERAASSAGVVAPTQGATATQPVAAPKPPTTWGAMIPEKMPTGATLPDSSKIEWNEDKASVSQKCQGLSLGRETSSGNTTSFCDATSDLVVRFSREGKLNSVSAVVSEQTFRREVAELIRRNGTESGEQSENSESWQYYYRNQKQDIVGKMKIERGRTQKTSKWVHFVSFEPVSLKGSSVVATPTGKRQLTEQLVPTSFPKTWDIGHQSLAWGDQFAVVDAKCAKLRKASVIEGGEPQYLCPKGNLYVSFDDHGALAVIGQALTRQTWSKVISEIVERDGTDSHALEKDAARSLDSWQLDYLDDDEDVVGTLGVVKSTSAKGAVKYWAFWGPEAE